MSSGSDCRSLTNATPSGPRGSSEVFCSGGGIDPDGAGGMGGFQSREIEPVLSAGFFGDEIDPD